MKKMTVAEWLFVRTEFRQYGYDPYDSETAFEWGWYLANTGAL